MKKIARVGEKLSTIKTLKEEYKMSEQPSNL